MENKSSLDKAASMSAKSNELKPNDASYEDTFAWICYKQAKYEMALQWIERSIMHDPKQAEALVHKGDILCKLSRINEAHEAWLGARALGLKNEKLDQKITMRQCID